MYIVHVNSCEQNSNSIHFIWHAEKLRFFCRRDILEDGVLAREHKDSELSTATVTSRDIEEGELNGLVAK